MCTVFMSMPLGTGKKSGITFHALGIDPYDMRTEGRRGGHADGACRAAVRAGGEGCDPGECRIWWRLGRRRRRKRWRGRERVRRGGGEE